MDDQRKGRKITFILMVTAVGLLFVIVVLFVTLITIKNAQGTADSDGSSENGAPPKKAALCLTPGCVRTAAVFLESTDRNWDPCDDFYGYACGKYDREAAIPDHRLSKRRTDDVEDGVKIAVRTILEEPKRSGEMRALSKAKDLYAACMNTTRIDELGTKPIEDLLLRLGEWTGLPDATWVEKMFNWDDFMITLNNAGLRNDFILSVKLDVEKLNSTSITLVISPPSLAIPWEDDFGGKGTARANYLELMKTVAEKMDLTREELGDEFEKVIVFESQLAKISSEDKGSRREMSLEELAIRFPAIEWIDWLRDLISKDISPSDRAILNMDESTFDKILLVQDKTSYRTLHNYMYWRTTLSLFDLLDKDFQQLLLNYESKTFGVAARPPRWEMCADAVNAQYKHAVGNAYVNNFLDPKVAPQVMGILKEICAQMKSMILEADWMDDQTRTKALEKAHQMKNLIGYSQGILQENVLDKYYEEVDVNPQEYFTSTISLLANWPNYNTMKHLNLKKTSWNDVQTASAHGDYNAARNQIEIPAGMLHKLYFDADRPNYVNYATIGYWIGHQIAHGFDDTEPSIVNDGKVEDWWQASSARAFSRRAKCVADQHAEYAPRTRVNRRDILRGNVADNAGVKAAYRAYSKLMAKKGPENVLPYFSLNAKQLFWMSYANIFCSKQSPSVGKRMLENEDHIAPRFRVNGVASNSPEFAKDFKCRAGSPMNPGKKCQVW